MTLGYPKRERFFAYRVVRMMTKTAAAQEMGLEACWLVSIVAMQEDAKRYSCPVTFWNEQLMPLLGFGGRARLVRIRDNAVQAGWLHYEAGAKGRPGKYWSLIPARFQRLGDSPVDESGDAFCRSDLERNSERKADGNQNGSRTANAHHSSLSLIPISTPPTNPPADQVGGEAGFSWKDVGDRLARLGAVQWKTAVEQAQGAACTPMLAMQLIDFGNAHAYGVGAILQRLERANPNLPLETGWPKPDSVKSPKATAEREEKKRQQDADDRATTIIRAMRKEKKSDEEIEAVLRSNGLKWPSG